MKAIGIVSLLRPASVAEFDPGGNSAGQRADAGVTGNRDTVKVSAMRKVRRLAKLPLRGVAVKNVPLGGRSEECGPRWKSNRRGSTRMASAPLFVSGVVPVRL